MKIGKWIQWVEVAWRNGGKDPSGLALGALSLLVRGEAPARVWRGRIRACLRCQFYDKTDRTCAGCGCHAPVKALDKAAKCWAESVGEGKWV